jgi:hypothetical protein
MGTNNAPVFGREDVVPSNQSRLPAELQGKTPEEIAEFYQRRERDLQEDFNNRLAAAVPRNAPEPAAKKVDFWSNPDKAMEDAIRNSSVSREEFARASGVVQSSMIEMAEFLVSQKHPDWDKYKPIVQDIMVKLDPWVKADKNMWETAYIHARGLHPELATLPGNTPPRQQVTLVGPEQVNPAPSNTGPEPVTLTSEEQYVAERMELTPQQFVTARKNMEENKFPLTMSNRPNRRA